jgi:hypothetical protein
MSRSTSPEPESRLRRVLLPRVVVGVWIAAALLLLSATAAATSDGWRVRERNDHPEEGYVLYVSATEDASYDSYKLETWLDAEPEEAAESIMMVMTSQRYVPEGQERRVLEQDGQEALIYTLIDMPMGVSDREVALHITQERDADTGTHRVAWESAHDAVPPPRSRVVRLPDARGYWEFAPDRPGRCRATYVSHADLGGSIPAWLVRPMLRGQVSADVQRLREAIRTRSQAVSAAPPVGSGDPGSEAGSTAGRRRKQE